MAEPRAARDGRDARRRVLVAVLFATLFAVGLLIWSLVGVWLILATFVLAVAVLAAGRLRRAPAPGTARHP